MRKGRYWIEIVEHAFKRADQRKIPLYLIYDAIQAGKMKRFGKNRVKFTKKFKKFTIKCVDEIVGNIIKIATITINWRCV